ncbi:MAG: hypothetical protein KGZ74_14325 [Chitinophagaceae bacterium]|nr:hypothetical protein [Chitinophagaceae bacterium]
MEEGKFKIETFMNNDITLIILIFSTVLLGSFAKRIFNTIKDTNDYKMSKIYLSSIVVSLLIFSYTEIILQYIQPRMMIAFCVTAGLVSVELIKKISTLNGLKRFINDFLDITIRKK